LFEIGDFIGRQMVVSISIKKSITAKRKLSGYITIDYEFKRSKIIAEPVEPSMYKAKNRIFKVC
jgi:hypothetical protein